MLGLDLSASAKLPVRWITLKWHYVVNLILDLIWIILVFYCKFCVFKIILFYVAHFWFFYQEISKPNIHNKINDISSFQNGLNDLSSSTDFCLKSKVIEESHNWKNMFFSFWALLLKIYIFEVVTFFSCLVVIQSTQFFSGSTYL